MDISAIRDWLSFIVLTGAAVTTILAFTPKGFVAMTKAFNWIERKRHGDLRAEIHRLDLRIDDEDSRLDILEKKEVPDDTSATF